MPTIPIRPVQVVPVVSVVQFLAKVPAIFVDFPALHLFQNVDRNPISHENYCLSVIKIANMDSLFKISQQTTII